MKVTIVGRVNVGKSTLFNRLIEEKKSTTSPVPGTTRDKLYGKCFWRGETFTLIDIGGFKKPETEQDLERAVQKQIETAIAEADLILFLIDIKEGIKKDDYQIAHKLKKLKKKTLLVLNKADNPRLRRLAEDQIFLKFGFGKPFVVSAINGSGLGDLLDRIVDKIKKKRSWNMPIRNLAGGN